MTTMATQPVVVSASARWVSTSSSRQTRMIVARGTCRSIVVYMLVLTSPPTAAAVVSRP